MRPIEPVHTDVFMDVPDLTNRVIEVKHLYKLHWKKYRLKDINFSLFAGECLGILGPNGAGKTTLLKIICKLIRPSSGEVNFNKISPKEIATIFDDQYFLNHLSGKENIQIFMKMIYGSFDGVKELKKYGLDYFGDKKYKFFSSGMKRRLDIASIFLNKNKLLFLLDEPTNTLDIESIFAFNNQVNLLKEQGKSFIVASHNAEELEKICDQFLFIDKGIILCGLTKKEVFMKFNSLETAYRSLLKIK
ncbi:MAG TPA: ABC transporter ATP-binding protein [Chitinophagaceae bacterium]|nr:ABC transporter ATP-binding protein [Chitinophagaceae bacterium]